MDEGGHVELELGPVPPPWSRYIIASGSNHAVQNQWGPESRQYPCYIRLHFLYTSSKCNSTESYQCMLQ